MLDTKLTARKLLEVITAVHQDPSNLSYCNLEQEVNTALTNSICHLSKYICSSLEMSNFKSRLKSKKEINSGMKQIICSFVGPF